MIRRREGHFDYMLWCTMRKPTINVCLKYIFWCGGGFTSSEFQCPSLLFRFHLHDEVCVLHHMTEDNLFLFPVYTAVVASSFKTRLLNNPALLNRFLLFIYFFFLFPKLFFSWNIKYNGILVEQDIYILPIHIVFIFNNFLINRNYFQICSVTPFQTSF